MTRIHAWTTTPVAAAEQAREQTRVMRRRSQQEMDQLVERAGFRKLKQLIDEDGIFTVSLAIKT